MKYLLRAVVGEVLAANCYRTLAEGEALVGVVGKECDEVAEIDFGLSYLSDARVFTRPRYRRTIWWTIDEER